MSEQNLFECHVTFNESADAATLVDYGNEQHFHYSQIDGDEVMGKGKKQYLTRTMLYGDALEKEMAVLCGRLEGRGILWQRRKIEEIILDERRTK
jgi:hypothetical protein